MVSHIFHLDDLLAQDDVDTILVNTNVYTHSTANLCTTINACKTMVSSYEKTLLFTKEHVEIFYAWYIQGNIVSFLVMMNDRHLCRA